MIFTVDLRQDALMAHLSRYPERLATSVVRAMNRLTIMVQARVKQKLSGEVLHVRTNNLRSSINREVRVVGSEIQGVVGTNVEYAAVHEYGFDGMVSVRAHLRQLRERGRMKLFKTSGHEQFGIWKNVRGAKTGKVAQVRGWFNDRQGQSSFLRHMRVPERSFLRTSLKEFEPVINIELQRALLEAFKP
jgi:phage gpG-like protein